MHSGIKTAVSRSDVRKFLFSCVGAALLSAVLLSGCQLFANTPTQTDITAGASETVFSETSAESNITEIEEDDLNISIEVGGKAFSAELYDNEAAQAFAEMLPLTLDMSELNGNEKYYYLDSSLPAAPHVPDGIKEGDIMLYGSECVVLFYKSFSTSYSYTPLGKVKDAQRLAQALGTGGITVTFRKQVNL